MQFLTITRVTGCRELVLVCCLLTEGWREVTSVVIVMLDFRVHVMLFPTITLFTGCRELLLGCFLLREGWREVPSAVIVMLDFRLLIIALVTGCRGLGWWERERFSG